MSHTIVTLGDRGRLVIPAKTRQKLGLAVGDRLLISDEGGELKLVPLGAQAEQLHGVFADLAPGRDLAAELIAERRVESARE